MEQLELFVRPHYFKVLRGYNNAHNEHCQYCSSIEPFLYDFEYREVDENDDWMMVCKNYCQGCMDTVKLRVKRGWEK